MNVTESRDITSSASHPPIMIRPFISSRASAAAIFAISSPPLGTFLEVPGVMRKLDIVDCGNIYDRFSTQQAPS